MEPRPPRSVVEIARRLEEAGYETWAVGGAVRDSLLGLPAGDWDLATRARPDEVRRLFRRTVPLGIDHGTVGVFGRDGVLYEVTTFRRDVETFGRHAVVDFADTVQEDLARRDFTCNALAWHPLRGEVLDPFGGLADLRAGVLRTVGRAEDRFAEDYLRVLRALRFSGYFRLAIEPAAWRALVAATPRLVELSAERVKEELWKVLQGTRTASAALSLYAASGAVDVLYPELAPLVGLEPGGAGAPGAPIRGGAGAAYPGAPPAGPRLDIWTASLLAVDVLPTARPLLRAAALFHGVGMPGARTRDLRGGWRFTGHQVQGARLAEEAMRRLRASNAETERVRRLVAHQTDLFPPDAPDAGIRRWLVDVGPDLARDLFRLRFALWRGYDPAASEPPRDLLERCRRARAVLRARPPLSVADLAVGGHDLRGLGLEPGPAYGRILRALLERVLESPELNEREALLDLVRRELIP